MKKILCLVLSVCMIIGLSACGNSTQNSDSRTIKEETLQYPGHNDDWEYEVYESYVVLTKYTGFNSDVAIPSEIEELPVVKLKGGAFKETNGTIAITIPESIIELEALIGTILSNTKVTNVTFESDEKIKMGYDAFAFCGIDSETAKNILNHLAGDTIPPCFFEYCKNITEITIPDYIKAIGESAFGNCENLIKLDLNNVVEINSGLVDCCGSIKELYIRNKDLECKDSGYNLVAYTLSGQSTASQKKALESIRENLTVYGYKGTYAATIANDIGCNFSPLD